jgi:acetyl esterase/lipase
LNKDDNIPISIWNRTPPGFQASYGQPEPTLTPYLVESDTPTAAIIVCPGGGYAIHACHESEPVARWLNTLGIASFALDYRVNPYHHPYPLLDARRAIQMVRHQSKEWNIDPQRVGMIGFSAGGHLSSTAGTHFEEYDLQERDEIDQVNFRPDLMILCYAAITFGKYGHQRGMERLIGIEPSQELRDMVSNELHVTSQTPPAFIWHTASDDDVLPENCLLFASALSACRIPYELHIFPEGRHGLELAEEHPHVRQWTGLCARWLKLQGFCE